MAINNPTDPSNPARSVPSGALLGLCDAWELKAEAMAQRAANLTRKRCPQTGALFRAKSEERSACAHEVRVFAITAHGDRS
jgi:hypothetical protein